MKNLIEYIKDKIYYVMGATIVIIILLIIIGSCSGNKMGSYSSIEQTMKKAAEKYYSTNKDRLPKDEKTNVQVSIGTLIDAGLMKEVVDPNNKEQTCSGYVQVKKVDKEYAYIPFLTCKGNYEPKFLTDVIKRSKLDEYGNGVYEMNGEYVYRGDDVKNYVKFNDQLWRIIKVDKDGDIKLMASFNIDDTYPYDLSYNSDAEDEVGVTTDYIHTNIRKVLMDFYNNNFVNKQRKINNKPYIVSKDLCIGKMLLTDEYSIEKECSIIKSAEKIGLPVASDYGRASLDPRCTRLDSMECINQNYLSDMSKTKTWFLTTSSENSYDVFYLSKTILSKKAAYEYYIEPVIYITSDSIVSLGDGNISSPYTIK